MKRFALYQTLAILIFFSMVATGCQAIGQIFSIGVWVGIIIVVAIIFVLVSIFRRRN